MENINNGKVILVFSAEWCGDCIVTDMYLPRLIEQYPEWRFEKIDRDLHTELAIGYNIYGIPSFVALENGEKVGDLISKDSKSEQEVKSWIDSL